MQYPDINVFRFGAQVDEVIDAVQDADLRDKLRTVCLTDDRSVAT